MSHKCNLLIFMAGETSYKMRHKRCHQNKNDWQSKIQWKWKKETCKIDNRTEKTLLHAFSSTFLKWSADSDKVKSHRVWFYGVFCSAGSQCVLQSISGEQETALECQKITGNKVCFGVRSVSCFKRIPGANQPSLSSCWKWQEGQEDSGYPGAEAGESAWVSLPRSGQAWYSCKESWKVRKEQK